MATVKPHKDRWRAQVERLGQRKSKVFDTKRQAQDWANRIEYEILNAKDVTSRKTLAEAFTRYRDEVSITKRGRRWEEIRLNKFCTYPIARTKMKDLTPALFADWRDHRLTEIKGASVRREMQLMSSVLTVARREWGWIDINPLSDVRKPPSSQRRNRIPTQDELERLAQAAGSDPSNATARAFMAFQFACETAMRAGEIVGLTWQHVDLDRRVAHLPMTKNGEARDVPLSSAACAILSRLEGRDPVFGLRSDNLDVLWRKIRGRAMVEGLTFHDSRHDGVTRLAQKLDVLDLARVVGHKDLRQLMTYYEADAEALAKKLD